MSRPFPTGRCNYRNLSVKTSDYNTHCGCQTFWLDDAAQELATSSEENPKRPKGLCVCGHHQCYHSLEDASFQRVDQLNMSKTFDDRANNNNYLRPDVPGWQSRDGLGLTLKNDASESTMQNTSVPTPAHVPAPSPVPSSAPTEVATNLSFSSNQRNSPPQEIQRFVYNMPNEQTISLQHIPRFLQEPSSDTPHISHSGWMSMSQRAMFALSTLNGISMQLLPPYIRTASAIPTSSPTVIDPTPKLLTSAVSENPVTDEVTRKAMAAEGAAKDLLQCLERSWSQVPSDAAHETPQKSSSAHVLSSPPGRILTPSPAKSSASKSSVPCPPREVSIPRDHLEGSLRTQMQNLVEKVEGLEDALEETANRAELAEDRVVDMEGRFVNVEDKVDNIAESFTRHKESSLGKRRREDLEALEQQRKERRRRKRSKLAKERAKVDESSELVKASSTHNSFSTNASSFASVSSCGSYLPPHQMQTLLYSLLSEMKTVSARLSVLEELAPPTHSRPWVVEVVVLPPSTWAAWKMQDNVLKLRTHAPRVVAEGGKAWRRLQSRGLIKTIEIFGNESRDVERAIRKAFGGAFRALHDSNSALTRDGSCDWSPLRKAARQSNLRFLGIGEMVQGFWKSTFLRRTCAAPIEPSEEADCPSHRIWITNCWTGTFARANRDDVSEYTQASSVQLRRRASSVASTQFSLLRRRRTDEESSTPGPNSLFGMNETGELGGGWEDIKNLPKVRGSQEEEKFWEYDGLLDGPPEENEYRLLTHSDQLLEKYISEIDHDNFCELLGEPSQPSSNNSGSIANRKQTPYNSMMRKPDTKTLGSREPSRLTDLNAEDIQEKLSQEDIDEYERRRTSRSPTVEDDPSLFSSGNPYSLDHATGESNLNENNGSLQERASVGSKVSQNEKSQSQSSRRSVVAVS